MRIVKQVFQDNNCKEIFVVFEDGSGEISNKNNETLYKMGKEITDLFLLDIKEENSTYTKVGK